MAYSQWRDVTKRNPCPICGKPDWCSTNEVFVCCRRGDGGGVERQDKSGGTYWLYRIVSDMADYDVKFIEPPPSQDSRRAEPGVLHSIYSSFANALYLSEDHKKNLLQRGLPEAEIVSRGYKSLPLQGRSRITKNLRGQFGDSLNHAPGFYLKENDKGKHYSTFAGRPGILIPVRNLEGQIIGFKIRTDSPGESESKYIWFSSNGRLGGTGVANSLHFPLFDGPRNVVRITEGELKADISTALSGVWTWSLPGVNSWRLALPILDGIKPEKVLVSFDADCWENRNVASHLLAFVEELQSRRLGGETA